MGSLYTRLIFPDKTKILPESVVPKPKYRATYYTTLRRVVVTEDIVGEMDEVLSVALSKCFDGMHTIIDEASTSNDLSGT
jgi:hypothetical protein